MGNANCQGAAAKNAARKPGGPLVLTLVRTANWGMGSEEDTWQVEVLGTATVKELKAKIEELYDVPQQMQRLSLGSQASDAALEDASQCEVLAGKRVYLNPASMAELVGGLPEMLQQAGLPAPGPEAQAALASMAEAFTGATQEMQQTEQALRESLQGVVYKVTFERPAEGAAAAKRVTLDLDALAQVQVVQQMVEVELFGAVGAEPAFLLFQGMPLPPHISLFHAGIEDGKTVVVSKERPPNPAEQLLGMLSAAGGLPAGLAMPPGMAAHAPMPAA